MFSPFTGTVSKKNDFYEVYVSTFIQPALITVYCFNWVHKENVVSSYLDLLNSEDFGSFIQNNKPAICILTVPTSAAVDYAKQASENGVAAIWNFANVDLSTLGLEAAVENVNLMDSLYTLTYYSRDGE